MNAETGGTVDESRSGNVPTVQDAFQRMWEHEAYLRDHYSGPIADRFHDDLLLIQAATDTRP